MTKYKTPKGKELETFYEGYATRVRFIGGGELPECLKGSWTDTQKAEQCIVKYLNDKEPIHIRSQTLRYADGHHESLCQQRYHQLE